MKIKDYLLLYTPIIGVKFVFKHINNGDLDYEHIHYYLTAIVHGCYVVTSLIILKLL
mgnify:CR=1 FL=1